MNQNRQLHFFLGTSSPDGFVSFYDELAPFAENGLSFLIRGGPGSGKSTLLRRASREFSGMESFPEEIHCSSDPDSLDAVILPETGAALADATPPHTIEPRYPGACESIVDLCCCWNDELLRERRSEILSIGRQNAACHRQCIRFLSAARAILSDSFAIAASCLNLHKISKTAAGIISRECRGLKPGTAQEKRRLLSAVTPKGLLGFPETVRTLCPRIYLIKDPYGAASHQLLSEIRQRLLGYPLTLYSCASPLSPLQKLDHLLIPELGLGFITAGRGLPSDELPEPYRVISFTRFTDMEQLMQRRQRLRFNRRAAAELLDAAVRSLRRAKLLHDALERQYAAAMDFEKAEDAGSRVIETIRRQAETPSAP